MVHQVSTIKIKIIYSNIQKLQSTYNIRTLKAKKNQAYIFNNIAHVQKILLKVIHIFKVLDVIDL